MSYPRSELERAAPEYVRDYLDKQRNAAVEEQTNSPVLFEMLHRIENKLDQILRKLP